MGKPVIGVVPLVDQERESFWMLPGYMNGIEQAGGIPVMLPLLSDEEDLLQIVNKLDGFLFTGGQDVSPNLYAEKTAPLCGQRCRERDDMEGVLFRLVYEMDKPLLGICRYSVHECDHGRNAISGSAVRTSFRHGSLSETTV